MAWLAAVDARAIRHADRLVAEADAEDWHSAAVLVQHVEHAARILWAAGARRQHDRAGCRWHFVAGRAVAAAHFDSCAEHGQGLREVPDERILVVEQQDQGGGRVSSSPST